MDVPCSTHSTLNASGVFSDILHSMILEAGWTVALELLREVWLEGQMLKQGSEDTKSQIPFRQVQMGKREEGRRPRRH